jgi:uncharacterized protein YukE
MTDTGKHLFYINRPVIEDKSKFRLSCPQFDEQSIVIGCYHSGQTGISVLQVTDSRLQGVEEVTAAHEMLHAAYERLSGGDKKRVNDLLQTYATNGLKDERIKATLASYQKSEPGQQLNEMHSIFGTEIAELPAELDFYYQSYFTDRSAVVAWANQYQAAFTSRQTQIKQYDDELQKLGAAIKANTASLAAQSASIESDRKRLTSLRNSGDIENYNLGVEPFNAKIAAYNNLLDATRKQITSYNDTVQKRNAIAAQTMELQKAIDSSSLPQSR